MLLVVAGLGCATRTLAAESAAPISFHVAFSSTMFTEINENDAKASIKAWAQTAARERGIISDPDARIITGSAAMIQALQAGEVDAVGLTIADFAEVSQKVSFPHVFLGVVGDTPADEYVVLVHNTSRVRQLAELQGRGLLMLGNPRTCLAEPWLDTLLLKNGLPAFANFFGNTTRLTKLSKVILPVFFQQADACLVTRRGFEIMRELNPQVGQQLRVIAASPALVTSVFCIRAGFQPPALEQFLAGLRELHTTPAGRQVLTIFQTDRLEEQPIERLAASLALLEEHARVVAATAATRVPQTAASGSLPKDTN